MRTILSDRLKECRTASGLTQKQVAEYFPNEQIMYVYYECSSTVPKVEVLIKLADLFGVSIDYLTGRTVVKEINR